MGQKADYILRWGAEPDASIDAAFAQVVAKAKAYGAQIGPAMSGGGKDGVLHDLKSQFGRGSPFKESLEALKGAGAVAGLALVGEELAAWSDNLLRLKEISKDESKNWADIGQAALESVPIFGSISKAGANINELFTSTKETIAAMERGEEQVAKAMELRLQYARQITIETAKAAEESARYQGRTYAAGLQGDPRSGANMVESQRQEMAAFHMQQFEAKSKVEEINKQIVAMETARSKEQQKFSGKSQLQNGSPEAVAAANAKNLDLQIQSLRRQREAERSVLLGSDVRERDLGRAQAAEREELARQIGEKELKQTQDHRHSIDSLREEQWKDAMEIQGKGYTAQIGGVRFNTQQQLEMLREETDAKKAEYEFGSKQYLQIEEDFQNKAREMKQRGRMDEAALRAQEAKSVLDQAKEHALKMEGSAGEQAQRYLQLSGNPTGSALFGIGFKHQLAADEIREQMRKEMQGHPERSRQIKEQGQKELAANKAGAMLDLAEFHAEQQAKYRPQEAGNGMSESRLLGGMPQTRQGDPNWAKQLDDNQEMKALTRQVFNSLVALGEKGVVLAPTR